MNQRVNKSSSNPVILGVEIWNAKGIQIILNKISKIDDFDFEVLVQTFKDILNYPGMWYELNITSFISIFYKVVKKFKGDIDNNITMQGIWKKFEWVRREQLMDTVTISTEDKVKTILNCEGEYSRGGAYGLGGVGAYSIPK